MRATPASAAARVSAKVASSATSSPEMKPMPLVLASTQPPRAAPLTAAPARPTSVPARTMARTPQPIWARAQSVKATTTLRSSPWEPAAVAWIAPAARDARAAMRSGAGTADDGGAGSGAPGVGASMELTMVFASVPSVPRKLPAVYR